MKVEADEFALLVQFGYGSLLEGVIPNPAHFSRVRDLARGAVRAEQHLRLNRAVGHVDLPSAGCPHFLGLRPACSGVGPSRWSSRHLL